MMSGKYSYMATEEPDLPFKEYFYSRLLSSLCRVMSKRVSEQQHHQLVSNGMTMDNLRQLIDRSGPNLFQRSLFFQFSGVLHINSDDFLLTDEVPLKDQLIGCPTIDDKRVVIQHHMKELRWCLTSM